MSWLKTARQLATLIFSVTLFLILSHACARIVGKSQKYSRIDHFVLNKVNNIIYLININNKMVVFENAHFDLPQEIVEMNFLVIDTPDFKKNLKDLSPSSECLFLQFNLEDQTQVQLDEVIEILNDKTCVFINTPFLKIKSYFSFKKPRWFFNVMDVDLQKSKFLSSLGLESLAPIKGDFLVIDQKKSKISDSLLTEIQRRGLIVFIIKHPTK